MGEDYALDPAIERGPLANRRCTDLFCLLLFLLSTGGAGYIGYYGYHNGNPDEILAPMDGDGNFCGKTAGYEDYPYILYTDISSFFWPPYGVCVTECPTKDQVDFPCKTTDNSPSCSMGDYTYDSYLFIDRWCLPIYSSLD